MDSYSQAFPDPAPTPSAVVPGQVTELLRALLACVEPKISPVVGRSLIMPGVATVWDDCCDGQLWVQAPRVEVASTTDAAQKCGVLMWDVTVLVGVVRCATVVDDRGGAPSVSVMTAEAEQILADADAIRKAVACCAIPAGMKVRFVRWTGLGPEGGCAGGAWELSVRLLNDCDCGP